MRSQRVERKRDIHVAFSEEEYRVLRILCDSDDLTMSQLVRRLIRDKARDRGILQPSNLRSVSKG